MEFLANFSGHLQAHFTTTTIHSKHSGSIKYDASRIKCVSIVTVMADAAFNCFAKSGSIFYPRFVYLGGIFEYVSGANFFGEILEWLGFAIGTWSLPGAAFAFFVVCNLGPRAFQHHR